MIFARRHGTAADGTRTKHYYVPESVGIATGFLIWALHRAGLSVLTHTPNPMKFLKALCHRPDNEKPVMILAVGRPAPGATGPAAALPGARRIAGRPAGQPSEQNHPGQ